MMTDDQRADSFGDATREKLKQFIARIERLELEKTELAADIREVYAEAKTFGFDGKSSKTREMPRGTNSASVKPSLESAQPRMQSAR